MFSRKIVGWDLSENMRSSLIINALNKAIKQRKLPKGLIVHSDGGGQYASDVFRNTKYDRCGGPFAKIITMTMQWEKATDARFIQ